MPFPSINPSQKFSEIEISILDFWKKNDIFQKSIDSRPADHEYVFFDGPPFATGTPHYGHILAGAIKDAIPRYYTMKGFRVNRKWGWDCHGVPVEFDVEKRFNIGGKPGIEKMGVANFNETCRSIVLEYTHEWEKTVERMGRFVDFKNDYKTMDPDFMESVWSVFRALWDKGLIYEGEKVVAYSPKLGSPLSNFEANLNYKQIKDKTLVVKFELKDEPNTFVLAWTTTPWTLPSNLALCVHPNLEYVKVQKDNEFFIIAKNLVEKLFGDASTSSATTIETISGKDVAGKKYKPLFPYFSTHQNAFQILADDFVSDSDGTGIVHMAPNFGEDDARVCQQNGISFLDQPIDENGYFTENTPELAGKYFRPDETVEGSKENNANDEVIKMLKEQGKIFKQDQYDHDYPFCWRTDCALMYRGVKTWFVDIQKIKAQMLEQNQEINWNPDHLKEGRFGKMLEGAPDWAISRNRYWGAPIPVWRCDECSHTEVISTREELLAKTGKEVNDLHKHFVDELFWECEKCAAFDTSTSLSDHSAQAPQMKRIPEVLDCWFESGAMPYASRGIHFQRSIFNNQFSIKSLQTAEKKENAYHFSVEYLYHFQNVPKEGVKYFEKYEVILGAFEKNVLVGIAAGQKNEEGNWEIKNVVVHPAYRRKKIAMQLLEKIKEEGEKRGYTTIQVWANNDSLEFYSTISWLQKTEKKLDKYHVGKETHTFFEGKNLSNKETEIFFVRHGESTKNVPVQIESHTVQSATKYPLTKKGKEDAEKEAQKYQNFFDVIVTSPFLRAKQTADIFQKENSNAQMFEDARLQDFTMASRFDNHPVSESIQFIMDHPEIVSTPLEDGESIQDVLNRVLACIGEYTTKFPGKKILFVTHGTPVEQLKLYEQGKKLAFQLKGFPHTLVTPIHLPTQKKSMQADFIAEGLDQTRGWFYTLHVLGCALTGKNIFKNVITNGIVLAEDGQKMSKSKKNYPDPSLIFDTYGADAMRFYMLSSPVVRAENFRFSEKGVEEVLKTILIPLQNVYSFFAMYANIDGFQPTQNSKLTIQNVKTDLDLWILGEYEKMRKEYTEKFEEYKLDEALRPIPEFIDSLTNWYIRRSRDRFWESGMSEEKKSGYQTLYFVLKNLAKILAPIMPFYAEFLWKNCTDNSKSETNSVHLQNLAESATEFLDETLSAKTKLLRELITLSASIRARKKIKRRQPLQTMSFALSSSLDFSQEDMMLLQEEVNVKHIIRLEHIDGIAKKIVKADAKQIGKRFGKKTQDIITAGKSGKFTSLENGTIEILGEILSSAEYEMAFECALGIEGEGNQLAVVLLDTEISDDLMKEGIAREIIRGIQETRKISKFHIADRIMVQWFSESEMIRQAYEQFGAMIDAETLTVKRNMIMERQHIAEATVLSIENEELFIALHIYS